MKQYAADNDNFLDICTNLIERMINTVPSNIQLGDPITAISVKPVNLDLQVAGDGSLRFSGDIRVKILFGPKINLLMLMSFQLLGTGSRQVNVHYQASQSGGS